MGRPVTGVRSPVAQHDVADRTSRTRGAALCTCIALCCCTPLNQTPPWLYNADPVDPTLMCGSRNASGKAEATPPRARAKPEEIQARVRSHYGELRDCYEDALGRTPYARARMRFRFVILESGKVENVCLERADLKDNVAATCMRDVFSRIVFEAPPGRTIVVYPIQFAPGKPKDPPAKATTADGGT